MLRYVVAHSRGKLGVVVVVMDGIGRFYLSSSIDSSKRP